jgi:hypothetical protein
MKKISIYPLILIAAQPVFAERFELPTRSLDGNWWLSIDQEQRLGFLAGYFCCSYFDLKNQKYSRMSWRNIEPQITEYYNNKSNSKQVIIQNIIKLFVEKNNSPSKPNSKKYSFFDGEYWRQSDRPHKIGFIEGYVNCWNTNKVPLMNSDGVEQWVLRLDKWYGIRIDDPSEINEKRVDAKIPIVMLLVKNK